MVLKNPSGNQVEPCAFFLCAVTRTPRRSKISVTEKMPIEMNLPDVGVSPAGGMTFETPSTRKMGKVVESA